MILPRRRDFQFGNLFHCCSHKSASQWFRAILATRPIRQRTGLTVHHCHETCKPPLNPAKVDRWEPEGPFPEDTIVVCINASYQCFQKIPKPHLYRGFFVLRDPRDYVVSLYYSQRYSHPLVGPVEKHRKQLSQMSKEEGLAFVIDLGCKNGTFDVQRSWVEMPPNDLMKVFRYEDLFGEDQFQTVKSLFDHICVDIPEQKLRSLLADYSFEKFSGGRAPGCTDNQHHCRRGVAGSWNEEFTPALRELFHEKTGELVEVMGYEKTL